MMFFLGSLFALTLIALLIIAIGWLGIRFTRSGSVISSLLRKTVGSAAGTDQGTSRIVIPPPAPLDGADEEEVTEETLQVSGDRPFFKAISGPSAPKAPCFLSPTGATHIGRAPGNNIVLADEAVSSKHCRVDKEGAYYVLTDLGSSNKVFVNGVPKERVALRNGDKVKIGSTTLVFAMFGDRA